MPEGRSEPLPDATAATKAARPLANSPGGPGRPGCGAGMPDVAGLARRLYRDAGLGRRLLQTHRDRICPFAPLLEQVPPGGRVLDVGCGAGLFVLLLAATGRADSAVGIDVDGAAVAAATRAASHLGELGVGNPERFSFRHLPGGGPLPEGPFDVVSLIDVMHHVPPGRQRELFAGAAARARPGGIVLYKDMCRRPLWRAWANRMHDLLLARQWIHCVPLACVEAWAAEEGLQVVHRRAYARLVYGHELLVMRKGDAGAAERSPPPRTERLGARMDMPSPGTNPSLQPPPDAAESRPGRAGRLARLAAWALLAAAVAEMGFRGPWRAMHDSSDLSLYYCCAKAWVQGANPYDTAVLRTIARQSGDAPTGLLKNAISPPVSFVVLAPLALLPWQAAKAVWLLANLALTAAMLHWLIRLAGLAWPGTRAVLLAALVLGLAPIHTCLSLGQLALAAAALLVGALYLQRTSQTWLEGILLALAGLLKPQMVAIFAVYWLYRRRWGPLAVAAGLTLAVSAVAVGRLQLAGMGEWLASWQDNVQACFRGGACDYAAAGKARVFLNLQHPAYAILGDRTAAMAVAWAFTSGCLLAGFVAWRRGRHGDDGAGGAGGGDLPALALLAVAGLLPVYHVFYDAAILVLPLAWAVRSLATPLRPYAVAAIALILPFLVSGAAMLVWLAAAGRLPAGWADAWWWRMLVIPHQPYLLAALSAVLVASLFRASALSRPSCPPAEPQRPRPS